MNPDDSPRDSGLPMNDFDLAQQALASIEPPALRIEDVPLSRAVGRVLAGPLAAPALAPAVGTRLTARHVPQLAATGAPTVRVVQQLKVGVLAITDPDPSGDPVDRPMAGPMLAALLDGLGAVGIAAPGVADDGGDAVGAVLDMLLDPCRIVLITGACTPARQAQVDQALAARGAAFVHWRLCDGLGARVSAARFDGQVVVNLPCGLGEAFVAFALLVSPLIRRFQGRTDLLPPRRAAAIHQPGNGTLPAGWFAFARETEVQANLQLLPRSASSTISTISTIDVIARADGIVRSVGPAAPQSVFEARYYPFSAWLR